MLEIQKKEFLGHFYNSKTKEEISYHSEQTQEFVNLLLEILEFLNFEYQATFNFENLLGLSNIKNLQSLLENKYVLPDFLQEKIINYLNQFKNEHLVFKDYYYPNQIHNPFSPFNDNFESILSIQLNEDSQVKSVKILKNNSNKNLPISKDLINVSAYTINKINDATSFSLNKGKRHKLSNQIVTTFLNLSHKKKNNTYFKKIYQHYFLSEKFGKKNYKINLMLPTYKEKEEPSHTKSLKHTKFLFMYNELKYNYIQYILIKKVLTYVKSLTIKDPELEVPIPNHNIINELFGC